ncbi:hypothetical protein QVD17_16553 [Tagetes erecta]|uniref:Integrase catalytic domain-containing protein n=1 Tax=Tagetes erecta TaxID=13708 RepID=A0AAD8KY40_TARER|nr:hypothetical protein QVD17_16553 [Tagetes erecta]
MAPNDDSDNRVPRLLNRADFKNWTIRLRHHLCSIDNDLWKSIEKGPHIPTQTQPDSASTYTKDSTEPYPEDNLSAEDLRKVKNDSKAYSLMCKGLPLQVLSRLDGYQTGYTCFKALKSICEGGEQLRSLKKSKLKRQLELFEHINGETVHQMMNRFVHLTTEMSNLGVKTELQDLNDRLLCFKIDNEWVVVKAPRDRDVYKLDMSQIDAETETTCLIAHASNDESQLWHRRLGHSNFRNMNRLVTGNHAVGIPSKKFSTTDLCPACLKGKQHRMSFKSKQENSISKPLQMLHMDLFGPTNVQSIGKKSYCFVIIDDFTRFSWVYFLHAKSETAELLKEFIIKVENQLDCKVKFSAPRTPQQNGVAERKNRTLIEAARSMLADAKIPITFWDEAIATACFVQNRTLLVQDKQKTSYELLFGRKPNISYLKAFGCPVTVLNLNDHLGKFESKSDDGFFLGYSSVSKAYRVFNSKTNTVIETINVKFLENSFPSVAHGPEWLFDLDALSKSFDSNLFDFSGKTKKESGDLGSFSDDSDNDEDGNINSEYPFMSFHNPDHNQPSSDPNVEAAPESFDYFINSPDQVPNFTPHTSSILQNLPNLNTSNLETQVQGGDIPIHRIHKKHPVSQIIGPLNQRTTRSQTEQANICLYSCFLSQVVPKNISEALQDNSWIEAMQEELLQFRKQEVWKLVDLPEGENAIGTRWLYKNKPDERGIVVRNKARLIAQGYTQEEGIDYEEVFAPVARLEAIRVFLAYASFMRFKVFQMDVKGAFMYGPITDDVYVRQPPGFEDPDYPHRVYKLSKALYGLHQAPRIWYETLSKHLLENGFTRGQIDPTLFMKRENDDLLCVQVYVDDIIFGSTSESMCKEFEEIMKNRFQMSSMGEINFFLGLQVKQSADGIFINQSKFVEKLLKKFKMQDCQTIRTPSDVNCKIQPDPKGKAVDQTLYRSMIGSLMYLTASRPDIMYAVCVCARYQSDPRESHLVAVKRIFRYLKGKPNLGLWYPYEGNFELYSYSDSDFGGCALDRKSTTGGCQFLGPRLVSWQCKKQTNVSVSTAEAEYIAASAGCSQVLWLQNQLLDYGFNFLKTPIYIDNTAAMFITANPVQHSKTKHIEIRYHFLRDNSEKGLIILIKVHTDKQLADLFTKSFLSGRVTMQYTQCDEPHRELLCCGTHRPEVSHEVSFELQGAAKDSKMEQKESQMWTNTKQNSKMEFRRFPRGTIGKKNSQRWNKKKSQRGPNPNRTHFPHCV